MIIAHLTDIHLNFLVTSEIEHFANECVRIKKENDIDCFLISGDLTDNFVIQQDFEYFTNILVKNNIKHYFVLGNHDSYGCCISSAKERASIDYKEKFLTTNDSYIPLNSEIALIGNDGWYDGMFAPFERSSLQMQDFNLITELREAAYGDPNSGVYRKCRELAWDASQDIKDKIDKSIKNGFKTILVVTHVPPFMENSTFQGKMSDSHWMPYFSSYHMGNVLLDAATNNSNIDFVVFCGHSHGEAKHSPIKNLVCHTGKARYNRPCISKIHII